MLIYLQMASMVFTLELFFLQSSTPIQRVWYSCFIALWHIKKFCISCNCMKCTNIIIFHSFEIFLNFWGLFFLKTLKKGFHTMGPKKNKLECLFIFSGGNCTLNLKISQIIFFTFFSEMVWILQVFKRLWQASMHTACQSSIFCPKSQQDIAKKLNFWDQKWTFDITVIQKKIFVQKIQA